MIFSFSRQPQVGSAGHLADHPLTNGRNVNERVDSVRVFTGSAFQVSGPHEPMMIFGENTVSRLPKEPWKFDSNTPSIPIEGWLQGAVLHVGEGRIAVFGEAAMFSAQIAADFSLMGMNAAPENLPFLLNVMHWLSGLLPDATGPAPSLTSAGVVNAASFGSSSLVSPGMFVSLFGEDLADSVSIASSLPLPADLVGTSATIGGLPLRLLVVSSGQINGVVPYGLSPGSVAPLVVTRNGVQSVAAEVNVRSAVPGIFTAAQSGQGQGVIARIDPVSGEQAIADESNSAAAGEVLVIYGSGLGEVSPAVEAGAAAPSTEPLARVILPVEVTIGGVNAPVLFAGLAPGFAGLYQINATVPPGVQPGTAIDVIVTVYGVASPAVTIAVGSYASAHK